MIDVDISQWPLVRARAHGALSLESVETYAGVLDELLGRGERFGMLFVTDRLNSPEMRAIRCHADWLKQHQAACAERWIGVALVLDQAIARFLMSTLLTLVRMPMPTAIFDQPDDAARWLAERFGAEQLPVPPALHGVSSPPAAGR